MIGVLLTKKYCILLRLTRQMNHSLSFVVILFIQIFFLYKQQAASSRLAFRVWELQSGDQRPETWELRSNMNDTDM